MTNWCSKIRHGVLKNAERLPAQLNTKTKQNIRSDDDKSLLPLDYIFALCIYIFRLIINSQIEQMMKRLKRYFVSSLMSVKCFASFTVHSVKEYATAWVRKNQSGHLRLRLVIECRSLEASPNNFFVNLSSKDKQEDKKTNRSGRKKIRQPNFDVAGKK